MDYLNNVFVSDPLFQGFYDIVFPLCYVCVCYTYIYIYGQKQAGQPLSTSECLYINIYGLLYGEHPPTCQVDLNLQRVQFRPKCVFVCSSTRRVCVASDLRHSMCLYIYMMYHRFSSNRGHSLFIWVFMGAHQISPQIIYMFPDGFQTHRESMLVCMLKETNVFRPFVVPPPPFKGTCIYVYL